mgnify:CR=1 FL=1
MASVHEKIWPAVLKVYGKHKKNNGESSSENAATVKFSCPLNPKASSKELKDKSNTFERYVGRLTTPCTAETYIRYRRDVDDVTLLLSKPDGGEEAKMQKCIMVTNASIYSEELK